MVIGILPGQAVELFVGNSVEAKPFLRESEIGLIYRLQGPKMLL